MEVLGPKHYSCRNLQNNSKAKCYGGVNANIFEKKYAKFLFSRSVC
jgi:hypothetical protein